jgi:hypothetical protein
VAFDNRYAFMYLKNNAKHFNVREKQKLQSALMKNEIIAKIGNFIAEACTKRSFFVLDGQTIVSLH